MGKYEPIKEPIRASVRKFVKYIMTGLKALLIATPLLAEETEERLTVFAASSLTDVLSAQAKAWASATGQQAPRLSFGASATMARQIEAGAPAHLFISANANWTTLLVAADRANQPVDLVKNRLVLVVNEQHAVAAEFTPTLAGFQALIRNRRLVLADPTSAPVGQYAKSFLMAAGLWDALRNQLAYAANARQALRLTERAGLPAFVYESDAAASKRIKIIYRVPEAQTSPILYQAVVIRKAPTVASNFLAFLLSKEASALWQDHGFLTIASN